MSLIRLNKFIAESGACARRKADELIADGFVTVDGRRATVGERIDPSKNVIAIRGKRIAIRLPARETIVLNKPRGVVTTMDDERGRASVAALLPMGRGLFPIGRLDADSTGVLLCTNDGALAHVLTHPRFGVEKRYRVVVTGELRPGDAEALGALGVRATRDGRTTFDMILNEGKNRQVRRMCAARGMRVVELTRIRFGPVALGGLAQGASRPLSGAERRALDKIVRDASALGRSTVRPTE